MLVVSLWIPRFLILLLCLLLLFRPFVPGPSASAGPPPSSFAFAADGAFDPGLADPSAPEPEVPVPSSVPDSVRAEIRHMCAYLVDRFLLAVGSPSDPPPPRALFEDFFAASTSPHQLYSLRGSRGSVRLWRRLILGWLRC